MDRDQLPLWDERKLFDQAVDPLAIIDTEARILRASRSWRRVLGWSPDDLVGTSLLDLFHPDDLDAARGELELLLDGEDAQDVEIRVRTAWGDYRWMHGAARSDLEAGRILVSGVDIHDRQILRQRLEHRIAVEEVIAEVATRLISADPIDAQPDIVDGLGQVAEALGADGGGFLRSDGTAEGTHFVSWAAERPATPRPGVSGLAEQWWAQSLTTGEVLRYSSLDELGEAPEAEANRRFLDERGIQSFVVVPLPVHGRFAGFVGVYAAKEPRAFDDDVVALLRIAGQVFLSAVERSDAAAAAAEAAELLALRNEELERSNEELAAFADRAAHDLKEPLARIHQAIELLPRVVELQGTAAEVAAIAQRGTQGLQRLIADLLTYAKVGDEPEPTEPVSLAEVVSEVLEDLGPLIQAAHARVAVSELPVVEGHRTLLRLLVQNLVANAVKFRRHGEHPAVRIRAEATPEGTVVSVEDNGIGVPPEQRERVFEMLTRLHPRDRYDGSGIGLATVAKIAAHHDGRAWIEESEAGGAAVRVLLSTSADA